MRIAIFGKRVFEEKKAYIPFLFSCIEKQKMEYIVYEKYAKNIHSFFPDIPVEKTFTDHKDLTDYLPDILISIGGDGSFLDTVNLIKDSGIPVFGINLGRMGFLSSCPKENIAEAFRLIAIKNYSIESRNLLCNASEIEGFDNNQTALNEFCISKSAESTMIKIRTIVDKRYLNTYWADGLLIATPTGSTAYSLSCGGPIITPDSKNFIITPIASHNLTVRPIVIPDSSKIHIEVDGKKFPFLASLDSYVKSFNQPTTFTIEKAGYELNIIKLDGHDFFETIREKLLWGTDVRN